MKRENEAMKNEIMTFANRRQYLIDNHELFKKMAVEETEEYDIDSILTYLTCSSEWFMWEADTLTEYYEYDRYTQYEAWHVFIDGNTVYEIWWIIDIATGKVVYEMIDKTVCTT
ncbi:hypothetical protein [Chamaesiphon sp.]|uniref:hypothetical protein n=1 Tax=Chamaesiphon sp. TaxID=2814140 RepID=UPI00359407BB